MLAILLALTAAAGFAFFPIFARLGGQRVGIIMGAAVSMPLGLALVATPALAVDMSAFAKVPLVGFLFLAFLAVITYPVARLLNFTAIARVGAARTSTLAACSPLASSSLAIIFLGERPNALIIIGTLAMVSGIIFVIGEGRAGESTNKGQ